MLTPHCPLHGIYVLALPSPSRPSCFKALWRFLMPDGRMISLPRGWSTHVPNQKPNNLRRENEIWYIVRENWSTGKVCWRHGQIKQNLLPHRNFANHPSHQLQNQSTTSLSVGQSAIDLGLQHRNEMLWFQIHNEMIIQDLASTASQRCSSVLYFFQAKLQVTIPS